MELIKKNIHMDRIKCKASTQITMEDDINITDSRPDVYQLIEEQGEVVIDEIRAVQDHVYVKGKLEFSVLYLSDDDVRRPASMQGSIPFDEQIYMEGVAPTDSVSIKKDLEDLSVGMINSRKLSVQSLIRLGLYVEELYDEEAAVELSSAEPVEFRQKTINLASLAIQKKDIFRIREEMDIPISLKSSGRTAGLEKRNSGFPKESFPSRARSSCFSSMKGKAKTVLSCGMRRLSRSAAFWTARG